jgi:beta-xylosidase
MAFSDDFSTDRMGIQWSFYRGSEADRARYRPENGALVLKAQGTSPADVAQRLRIRIRNDRHIVTMQFSTDGKTWRKYDRGMELSGYQHNVAYEFLSVRPALYAAGTGEVRFRNFRYRALP